VTATSSNPGTEAPKRGVIAAAIALAAHVLVVLAAFVAARVVGPGEGMQDLAAVVGTLLGGEILVALTCVIVSAVQFRRGWRYTAIGLMSGWLAGFVAVMVLVRV
jgi:hypothetical protein